jgi:hypothetical protein
LKSDITKWVLGALMVASLASATRAQPQERDPPLSRDKPLFEVDVRRFGYERFSDKKAVRPIRIRVDFIDANSLSLAWATADDLGTHKKTVQATARPGRLQVLLVDAKTREKRGQQEWNIPSIWFGFLALRDGKFITCTGNTIHLFSSSFELVRERALGENSCPPFGSQNVSPSQRSLLLSYFPKDGLRTIELRDTQTFEVISKWTEVPGKRETASASDQWIAGLCGDPADLCVRGVGQSWRPLHIAWKDANARVTTAPIQFVNDDTFVIERYHMIVARVDSSISFSVELPKGRFGISVKTTGGSRFAVVEGRMRGLQSTPLDMYPFLSADRVAVYSLSQPHVVYALKLQGTSPRSPWAIHFDDLAISPDGSLLAVVSDGILKVYRLPQ